MVSCLKSNCLF